MIASRLSLYARPAVKQLTRPKSTYVYSYDKTFLQKWMEGRVKKINEFQKLLAVCYLLFFSFQNILKIKFQNFLFK